MADRREFQRIFEQLGAAQPELIGRLRTELAERSPCEAGACPSWAAYARWLRESGHADVGEWLALTLAGQRRTGDRARLLAVAERTISTLGDTARALWTGKLGWSLWFGPFMLVYVGDSPQLTELQVALGPLATFLAYDRVWIDGDPERWLLTKLERGARLLLTQTLPGSQEPLADFLLRELREHYGELALSTEQVSFQPQHDGMFFDERTPARIRGALAVICYPSTAAGGLDWNYLRFLDGVAVVGPPEMIERWPESLPPWSPSQKVVMPSLAGRSTLLGPLPEFERRYERLADGQPNLIAQLRSELAARPLAEAHACPSWPVFLDWMLEQGWEPLADWLRLDLADRSAGTRSSDELADHLTRSELAPCRPSEASMIRKVWSMRSHYYDAWRSEWLGPFMLGHFDPDLSMRRCADELQALLGVHATFLARARVVTHLDRSWIAALRRSGGPTLAPVPGAAAVFGGMALRRLDEADTSDGPAIRVRIAKPGKDIESFHERVFATNVGPIAANSEATAILCCETEADLQRHDERWSELEDYDRLILVGTAELLARWSRPARWIEPYRPR